MGSANLFLHNNLNLIATLNDLNTYRVNTLRVIKDYPHELQKELRKLAPNKQTLKQFFEDLQKTDTPNLRSKTNKIAYACKYYYVYNLSYYAKGQSLDKNITTKKYRKRVNSIIRLSLKLQDVEIKNTDGLYLLDKLAKSQNSLIYLDPPYIYSEEHYDFKKKIFLHHVALRNRILKLRSNNNICFISYRCTTPNSSKHTDDELINKLDSLYQNNDFYIAFKKVRNQQIEILIGTVPFIESVPYDQSIAILLNTNL
jgi:site-specific DNA-adenine methylase